MNESGITRHIHWKTEFVCLVACSLSLAGDRLESGYDRAFQRPAWIHPYGYFLYIDS
jgi:hypothetical protein